MFSFWKKKSAKPAPAASQPAPATRTAIPDTPAAAPAKVPAPMPLGKGHPGTFAGAENPLEEALMAYRERRISDMAFFDQLFNSQIYVLVPADQLIETAGGMTLRPSPRLFCIKQPQFTALAYYTATSRAKPTTDLHPEMRFAIQVHAGHFLLGLQETGVGLVLNPYWDINLEFSAKSVDHLRTLLRQ